MKKFKISWKQFTITILTIIILGSLVYFLEKDWRATPIIEGLETQNGSNKKVDPSNNIVSMKDPSNNMLSMKDSNNNNMLSRKDPSNNMLSMKDPSNNLLKNPNPQQQGVSSSNGAEKPKKEAFTNLNFAPIEYEGKSSCLDPLTPYENYSCGPTNVTNFFGNIKFKPECCGNPAGSFYSNSVGCACICPEQWNYLNSRGGNRTFPSEF
jgi:hypothetical protein